MNHLQNYHHLDRFADDALEKMQSIRSNGGIQQVGRKRRVRVQVLEEGKPSLQIPNQKSKPKLSIKIAIENKKTNGMKYLRPVGRIRTEREFL